LTDKSQLVVWRFIDGKPGHENQTQGLLDALSEKRVLKIFDIKPESFLLALKYLFKKSFPLQDRMKPDMVMGAGHATHLSVLAVKRSFAAKAIVLMKPSWPTALFDLCIVPEHDGLAAKGSVITTLGVLNRIIPSARLEPDYGVILIGGPSAHYDWHDDAMIERIQLILEASDKQWVIATSRRTPDSFVEKIKALSFDNLTVVVAEDTDADWLPQQLQRAGNVWITEDSVSMVYEALTAGANCGILPVQRKQDSRVSAGIDNLIEDGRLTSFEQWLREGKLLENECPLNESARVAEYLLREC